MNTSDGNKAVLDAPGPLEVAAYLRGHGWRLVEQVGSKGVVWAAPAALSAAGGAEILLPMDRSLGDYAVRMAEALEVLSAAEARPQRELMRDVSDAMADVIRIQLHGVSLDDGSIPLDQAAFLVASAREMLLAAACSAAQPRLVYRSRKPTPATEYLSKVRLGQTERGSFVFTIRSLVPPQFTSSQESLFPDLKAVMDDAQEPFERRVTLKLAHALSATTRALSEAGATSSISPFQEAVEAGVSANLYDALAGLGNSDTPQDVSIRMNWASTRPVPAETPSRFHLSADVLPVLREAARVIRESAPYGTFELRGSVVELRRDEGALIGQVTVAAVVDGKVRRVGVELQDADYNHAIEAHQFELPILCEGELVKEGRSFRLMNPRNFAWDREL